ncbi:transposase [Burkholderia pseudomallei]|nr:transposase [Burkholderia pseudomallei]
MLKTPMPTQHELEMVTLEELVPKDHLLRQIDAAVDFEFIRAKVAHLYCADNGRPALDPVVMFKLLFIGYLFGVRSERQLMREVQVNVAYRWFARFRLTDKVPDASTFSQNRRRRFTDTTVYQEIFDEIVRQAIKRGLVDGRVLYTDSTHLKANANKGKFDVVKLEQTPAAYTEALNAAVDADRAAHGRKPLDRSFADAKQLHGHRYARMRGLRKVAEQCLLAAAAQNIKKIAMLLARKRKKGPAGPDWRFVRMLLRLVSGLRCSFDYPLAANPQS